MGEETGSMGEVEEVPEEDKLDFEGPEAEEIVKLKCSQCEFLSFRNIDQWKNHVVGHWRLAGMEPDYEVVCFAAHCSHSPKDDNMYERLSKLGQHFMEVHSFKQAVYKKCDICTLDFMEERKYNSHMRKHDESFQCELCKKKITGKLWFERHTRDCTGDERPKWAREGPVLAPGEDKEVLEIYGKEYDVHWGEVVNTFTKVSRIVARAWIEGKAWAGKGETRDEARTKLIKFLKDNVKKRMDRGLYTLEDGELIPEPTLTEKGKANKLATKKGAKMSCSQCGTQFSKKANLELHMLMHKGEGGRLKGKKADKEKA